MCVCCKGDIHVCMYVCVYLYVHMQIDIYTRIRTGWRRLIRCFNLPVIVRKRATNHRVFLRKMTYKDTASHTLCHPVLYATLYLKGLNGKDNGVYVYVYTFHSGYMYIYKYIHQDNGVCTYDKIGTYLKALAAKLCIYKYIYTYV